MALIAKSESDTFQKPSIGLHQAVCVFVEDIGTHSLTYNGDTITNHKVVIGFEIAEKIKEGEYKDKPFLLSNFYTLSLDERSNLSKDLESWFSKTFTPEQRKYGFDLEKLVKCNCTLNLIEKVKSNNDTSIVINAILPEDKSRTKLIPVVTTAPEWVFKMKAKGNAVQETTQPSNEPSYDSTEPDCQEDDLPF